MDGFNYHFLRPHSEEVVLAHSATHFLFEHGGGKGQYPQSQDELDDGLARLMIVATGADDKVAAAVSANVPNTQLPAFFYISELATHPQFQREHRLGSNLLSLMEGVARECGADRVLVISDEAKDFFKKQGYVELIGEGYTEDEGAMQKDLRGA